MGHHAPSFLQLVMMYSQWAALPWRSKLGRLGLGDPRRQEHCYWNYSMPVTQSHGFWWTRQTQQNQGPPSLGLFLRGKPLVGRLESANGRHENGVVWSVKGLLVTKSRCPGLAFRSTALCCFLFLSRWVRHLAVNRSSEQGNPQESLWGASSHAGLQQSVGNAAVSARSKTAKISRADESFQGSHSLEPRGPGFTQALPHSMSRRKDNRSCETRRGSLMGSHLSTRRSTLGSQWQLWASATLGQVPDPYTRLLSLRHLFKLHFPGSQPHRSWGYRSGAADSIVGGP